MFSPKEVDIGQTIYETSPIFNEFDICPYKVVRIDYDKEGIVKLYYHSFDGRVQALWMRNCDDVDELHLTLEDAIARAKREGKAYTVYDINNREIKIY